MKVLNVLMDRLSQPVLSFPRAPAIMVQISIQHNLRTTFTLQQNDGLQP